MIFSFPYIVFLVKRFTRNWIFLSLLSSLLLYLAFNLDVGAPFGWIALIPLYIVLIREKLSRAILSSLLTGVFFNFFYLIWLKEYNHPLTLPLSIVAELLYFCASVVLSWLVIRFVPDSRSSGVDGLKIFLVPALWTFIDYLKTVGFLAFPWGILSYTQYRNIYFIQSASIFGVWGIDFLVIYFNFFVASAFINYIEGKKSGKKNGKKAILINGIVLFALILSSYSFGLVKVREEKYSDDSSRSVRLSLVQANFNPWDPGVMKSLRKEIELTRKTLDKNPDLVIWSESSVHFPFDFFLKLKNRYAIIIDEFAKSLNRGFVFGSLGFEGEIVKGRFKGKFYNTAYFYSPDRGYQVYRKIHLVPFGEWFPYKKIFPFVARILEKAGAGDFTPGNEYKVFKYGDLNFNVLICFEDVFGDLARRFVLNGSRMLINVTNDAWSGSRIAEKQHFVISILRTVENRVPLVRVANGGVTGWVDPYGRVKSTLPLFKKATLVCDVPYKKSVEKLTFYTRHGDFLPKLFLLLNIAVLFFLVIRKIVDIVLKRNNI